MALTDNIIGCWSPSIRGGGGILPDLSGYANHALPVGLSGTMWTGSQVGTVLNLPASNYQLNCGTMGGESFANGFTFVSWCYNITTPNSDGALVGKDSAVMSWISAGKVNGFWGTTRITSVATITALTRWQCVILIWDRTMARIFIDGRQDNSQLQAAVPSAATNIMRIGNYAPGIGGRYVTGLIGETVVYNRGISGPEAYEIFRRGNGAIGQMLTGQMRRRRTYGFVTGGFKAYWARRQGQIIGGGL